MTVKYTNIVGNLITGFVAIGVYDTIQEASDWQDGCDEDCSILEIHLDT